MEAPPLRPLQESQRLILLETFWEKSGWVEIFRRICVILNSVTICPLKTHQALESKLAACRNFAKDQAARKSYSTDKGPLINSNATKFSHSIHTTYFDKT